MKKHRRNWTALWITSSWQQDANPLQGSHLAFRRDYLLDSRPKSAQIAITACARYVLWINGVFIETGPSRSYPKHHIYDWLDITQALEVGTNAVAILVQKPSGVTGYSLVHRMGLFVDGEIIGTDAAIPVRTDASWKVRNADWYVETPFVCSIPVGFQEHVDGGREPAHWKTEALLEGWKAAFCLGGAGTPPWKNLVPTTTKKNVESPFTPCLCWTGTAGREVLDVRVDNIARAFEDQAVTGAPQTVEEKGDALETNEKNVFVWDFGKTRTIRPGVDVTGLSGDVRLEFFYDLSLCNRPHTMLGFGHDREGFCDSFVPHAANTSWRGLTPRGCRFLTVKISGDGHCQFRLRTSSVEYPYEVKNRFQCTDVFLQRLWNTSVETLRSATTDVIGEPARENVLWTFDACVGGKAAYYSFGDTAMWKHGLQLVAQGIDEDGIPNAVVPAGASFMILIDQALHWVHSCKEYYWATGDQEFLMEQLSAIHRLLAFCQTYMTDDDLLIPPSYAWHWVDWAPLNKQPYSMPINGMLLMAAQAAYALSHAAPGRFERLRALSEELMERLGRALMAFYDERENCFRSHVPAAGDHPVSSINRSVPVEFDLHSNALACLTGLGSPWQRGGAVAKMLQILDSAQEIVASMDDQPFGIGWTQLILKPIFDHGYGDSAVRYLHRYFKPFLDLNAPTWAEDFVPNKYNTAHGWGACVNSLIVESICGLRSLEPGWRKLGCSPQMPPDLDAEYHFQVPGGDICFKSEAGTHMLLAPSGMEMQVDQIRHVSKGEWIERKGF